MPKYYSDDKELTLSQLRTLIAIYDNELNVTAAAQEMDVAQPSVSKKLSALETLIGSPLFYRNGKRFQYETDLCRELVPLVREILLKCDNLKSLAGHLDSADISGRLVIGTTHTQARYVLPQVLNAFRQDYPNVVISIRQGAPADLVRLLSSNHLDCVICTEALENNRNFSTITSFRWNRCLLLPARHPLATQRPLTLAALAGYPIVTYTSGFTGRSAFDQAFTDAGLSPRVMVSATDADVIKTYVRLGFGIGIVAQMAYEKEKDRDLTMRPLNGLFPEMKVRLAYQREKFISPCMQRFIELFTEHSKTLLPA